MHCSSGQRHALSGQFDTRLAGSGGQNSRPAQRCGKRDTVLPFSPRFGNLSDRNGTQTTRRIKSETSSGPAHSKRRLEEAVLSAAVMEEWFSRKISLKLF